MGSTNKTTNLELSQFLGTDKPSWLNDYNADMLAIDSAVGENVTDISTAQSRADSAYTLADNTASSVSALSTQVSANTTDIATAQGNITTINSLIGNGTPTTTDQTIIGAINEINANALKGVKTTIDTSAYTTWSTLLNAIRSQLFNTASNYNAILIKFDDRDVIIRAFEESIIVLNWLSIASTQIVAVEVEIRASSVAADEITITSGGFSRTDILTENPNISTVLVWSIPR